MDLAKRNDEHHHHTVGQGAAEIVLGEGYIDHTPFEHARTPAVRDELKRAGFTHAQVRPFKCRLDIILLEL